MAATDLVRNSTSQLSPLEGYQTLANDALQSYPFPTGLLDLLSPLLRRECENAHKQSMA